MPETTYCPVCGSKATYFQLSGPLTCQDCGLIYKSITKETINNPEAILEARRLLYRRLRNPKEFPPRTKEELARDKHVNLYFGCENPTMEDRFNKTFKDFDENVPFKSATWPEGAYNKLLKDDYIGSPEMTELLNKIYEDEQPPIQVKPIGLNGDNYIPLRSYILDDPAEYFEGCEIGIKDLLYGSCKEIRKSELKDSGARREFDTGAVRDISEGKGRCDLLPLDVVGELVNSTELNCIELFKETKKVYCLMEAITIFAKYSGVDIFTMLLECSKHFEAGALKYGENNWKKGIPLHCYLDSAVRHYLKHLRGDTDEPHDRAFVWNLLCAIWTFKHMPELDDVERDLVKEEK